MRSKKDTLRKSGSQDDLSAQIQLIAPNTGGRVTITFLTTSTKLHRVKERNF